MMNTRDWVIDSGKRTRDRAFAWGWVWGFLSADAIVYVCHAAGVI